MSLPGSVTRICSVCGEESTQTVIMSTNTLGGSPDLDLRPPEMMRSTMGWWIQRCPHCGYVADDLTDLSTVTRQWLEHEAYTSCNGHSFKSELAEMFYKSYLIHTADGNAEKAFFAALHGAWACDDEGAAEEAIHCRECALAELEKLIAAQMHLETCLVVKTDLLRRTGQFDRLIAEYTGKRFWNTLIDRVVEFQIEKAKQKDTGCYRITDTDGMENG